MRSAAPFAFVLDADREDPIADTPIQLRPAAASTEQEVKDQDDKAKIEARECAAFWQFVLADRIGRREIFKLLKMIRAFETSPFASTPIGFPDPNATFYNAGQIDLGRQVYQMLAIVARGELFALQDEFNVYAGLAQRPDRVT